jgi:type VI secretion system protein ImpF
MNTPFAADNAASPVALQPTLLDRLTDDEPRKATEPFDKRVLDKARLKQCVLRDLAWLLNTSNAESDARLAQHREARNSVINFGMRPLSGSRLSEIDWIALERSMRRAILDFEPRILPPTLQVKAVVPEDLVHHHNMLALEIRCQMWAQPYPFELLLRTSFDLESGEVLVQDRSVGA